MRQKRAGISGGECWNCGYDLREPRGAILALCPECRADNEPHALQSRREQFVLDMQVQVFGSIVVSAVCALVGFLIPLALGIFPGLFRRRYPLYMRPALTACHLGAMWCMVVPTSIGSWAMLFTRGTSSFWIQMTSPLMGAIVGSCLFVLRWRQLATRAALPRRNSLVGIPLAMIVLNIGAAVVHPIGMMVLIILLMGMMPD